jgi:excinuclease ABC subunit B
MATDSRKPAGIAPEELAFSLHSRFEPRGDQPQAIRALNTNIEAGAAFQTLRGITGSGKTFTIAHVLARQNRPALVIAPNKTLAAQLYAEFKEFFPENRVRYFVSYYDYYQPEAYVPSTDTYIEKDSAINEEIDKMRHSATRALLEARDTIVVASVSCIYGLGAPEEYFKMMLFVEVGQRCTREALIQQLVTMQYRRSDVEFARGNFRVRGDQVDVFPADQDAKAIRIVFFGAEIEELREIDAISGTTVQRLARATVYPVSHYVTGKELLTKALVSIKQELNERLEELRAQNKLLELQRLEQRTLYDLELLSEVGFCPGIENYSRHLAARAAGEAPTTLIDYFPDDFILVIDESHVTVPQLGAMYRGDRARKLTLVDFGFRLPSALDNRPLNSEEFWQRVGQTIFVSATPGPYELSQSGECLVEQINRPTGLLDPPVFVRPALNQVDDLLGEISRVVKQSGRILVTTLTKKMAEDLASYLREAGIRGRYLHSDVDTLERVEILRGLRRGDFDVLIGINLLREGLDLVEVSLVAILDADKEGFLRSTTSLIQTMGRAARNLQGRVIMYADRITLSMRQAIEEADRRRIIQAEFNKQHGIVPTSAQRPLEGMLTDLPGLDPEDTSLQSSLAALGHSLPADPKAQQKLLEQLRREMFDAAAKREFERAAQLRDCITGMQKAMLVTG